MKSWCNLSWTEKCKINAGEVNTLKYQSGYDFRVKTKVRESKIKLKNLNQSNSHSNDSP